MIDYSAAPMLYGELSLQESGRELYELLLRVANGEETKAEKLGDYSWTTPTEPVTTATIDFCCAGPGGIGTDDRKCIPVVCADFPCRRPRCMLPYKRRD